LRPRVWVYSLILALALAGIVYGLSSLEAIEVKVLHERAPLYVQLSDGSIQNKYTLKVLNKSEQDLSVRISAEAPVPLTLIGADEPLLTQSGEVTPMIVFVKIKRGDLTGETLPVVFHAKTELDAGTVIEAERESAFFGPTR
jgi:polyferredoxin